MLRDYHRLQTRPTYGFSTVVDIAGLAQSAVDAGERGLGRDHTQLDPVVKANILRHNFHLQATQSGFSQLSVGRWRENVAECLHLEMVILRRENLKIITSR